MTQRKRKSSSRTDTELSSRAIGIRVFLSLVALVSIAYIPLLAYHFSVPRRSSDLDLDREGWLEQCRATCVALGLLPTGHIANDARAYLDAAQPNRLTEALAEILDDREFQVASSEDHPLIGKKAPEFVLPDVSAKLRPFQELSETGSIVVFYYGYDCSHCVAQLFALERDLDYFRQLGMEIVAISADAPEHTARQFKKYGRFRFPVLSDQDHAAAAQYGVFTPENNGQAEGLEHGTFVIDRSGRIVWAYQGAQPFLDNKSLIFVAAKAQGVLHRNENQAQR